MLQFLLVTALQFNPTINAYGNPYRLYIQRSTVAELISHVEYICSDWAFKECSKNVVEVCEISLTNQHSVVVRGKCSDIEHRITEGLR